MSLNLVHRFPASIHRFTGRPFLRSSPPLSSRPLSGCLVVPSCTYPQGVLGAWVSLHRADSLQVALKNSANGRDETAEQARERRLRESLQYENQTSHIDGLDEWKKAMMLAGKNLVVIEVQSETVCQTGLDEQIEYQWKDDVRESQEEVMMVCSEIKHTFQRIARDCTDATFLQHTVDDDPTPESTALCEYLGIEVIPTLQFWREGKKLWEHRGALHLDNELAEGVLYFEGSAANGVHVKDFVQELKDQEQFRKFITEGDENVLKVVNVALTTAGPCIRVYPAVLALAKNFVGYASFARVLGDSSPELQNIMQDYNVVEVPTFLFFRQGKEVGRHVGSSRADLIGQILQLQQNLGISPPPRPGAGAVPLRRKKVSWR